MTRANPLPPDERRAAILEAALPLLEEHGSSLSTKAVAESAGIAEGTLFRAFPTRQDLMDAIYAQYLSPERLRATVDAVALGDGLEARTRAALTGLVEYFRSVRIVLAAAHGPQPHDHSDTRACYRDRFGDVREWLVTILEPFADHLNIPVASYAHYLKTLAIGHVMGRTAVVGLDEMVSFALDGARRKASA